MRSDRRFLLALDVPLLFGALACASLPAPATRLQGREQQLTAPVPVLWLSGLVLLPEKEAVVAGCVPSEGEGRAEVFVAAVDAEGEWLWWRQPGLPLDSCPVALSGTPGGELLVASVSPYVPLADAALGPRWGGPRWGQGILLKLGPDGTLRWRRELGALSPEEVAVAANGAGRSLLAGIGSCGEGGERQAEASCGVVMAVEPQGRLAWRTALPPGLTPTHVATTESGGGLVAGRRRDVSTSPALYFVAALSAEGTLQWLLPLRLPASELKQLMAAPDGGAVLLANTWPEEGKGRQTLVLEATADGVRAWEHRTSDGEEVAVGMTASTSGEMTLLSRRSGTVVFEPARPGGPPMYAGRLRETTPGTYFLTSLGASGRVGTREALGTGGLGGPPGRLTAWDGHCLVGMGSAGHPPEHSAPPGRLWFLRLCHSSQAEGE